ncbi:TetR family transcriptional regulator [Kiritimatiellota bacterium B12222]|nr:TetR family transcriptional regulator [Kiritimatiellota bacterium B12222]
MARRTKKDALETRKQILIHALDVFSRKGYSRTTFVDIANQIGLTKGAVYGHFKSKPDLLVSLIEEAIKRKHHREDNPNELEPSIETLRYCYLHTAKNMLKDPFLKKFEFFIQFQIEWSEELLLEVRTRLAEIGADPFRMYSVAIQRLQELKKIEAHHDAEQLGAMLIAMWMGSIRMLMIGCVSEAHLLQNLEKQFNSLFNDLT